MFLGDIAFTLKKYRLISMTSIEEYERFRLGLSTDCVLPAPSAEAAKAYEIEPQIERWMDHYRAVLLNYPNRML